MEAKYKFIFVARVSVRTAVMHAVLRLTGLASYSENDVDCPRLLQLLHFGEKLDSGNCGNTCDSCSKIKTLVEKDVTESTKQLVSFLQLDHSPLAFYFFDSLLDLSDILFSKTTTFVGVFNQRLG
ncbi:hypothetical protein DKX38_029705 [Salix brachista]|uniref:ATP-dependent DNA helicase RecQ zinc-binding domain-containing protein n=1 Tax=Salix brachista TaxID=2182728 RepID=A0A5N5JC39_9ROSI|nr:hypothetical protein DKX38_029705 [Salix brachista]